MYISRLKAQRFRKFKDIDLTFDPGLNIIKGPNEQGKSTVVAALVAGLFFDSKKNNKAIRDYKSWDEERMYEILIELQNEGEDFVLQKDFENKHLLLKNVTQQTHFDTFNDVTRELEKMLGVSTASLFESTACIRQDKIAELTAGKKELDAALQDVVTSGADAVSAVEVLKQFKKVVVNLKKGIDRPAVKPGPIKILRDEVAGKEMRLNELRAQVERIDDDKKQNKDLTQKKKQIEKLLEEKKQLFEHNQKIVTLDEKKEVLEKSLEGVLSKQEQVTTLDQAKKGYQEALKEYAYLHEIDFADVERKLIEFAARKQQQAAQELESPKEDSKKAYYIAAGISALIGIGGVFIHPFLYGFFVLAIGILAYAFLMKKKLEPVQSEEHTVDFAHAEKELLGDVKADSYEDFVQKKNQYQQIVSSIEKTDAALNAVLGSISLEELEQDKKRISKDIVVLEAQYDQLGIEKRMDPSSFHALEREVQSLTVQLSTIEQERARVETRVDLVGDEIEELTRIEEELPFLKEKLLSEEKRLAVFEHAFMGILEAKNIIAASAKDVLTEDMNEYLPFITNGKYSDVSVDNDLVFYVKNEMGEMIRPEEYLSRGTIDQFYLAARFSLVKMLSAGKRPPLILDDPFVTFDYERTRKTMELVKKLSEEFQIFLMTYSDEYDEWGKVIEI